MSRLPSISFAQVVSSVAEKYVLAPVAQAALKGLGAKAEQPIETFDTERRILLATQFVRALRNVGVAEANRLEHALYEALDAAPTSRRSVVIKDAISLIAVRNHVAQVTTALGVPWSSGMQVQSAISDVARFVSANGGGQIETEAKQPVSILFLVKTNRPLGAIALDPASQTPPWLVGVAGLTRDFHARNHGSSTVLEFWISLQQAA